MRAWSYVITTDRGSAPNYEGPAVTLAICKPRIRKKAKPGDLILAFNGRSLSRRPHSLRWAGIVSEVLLLEDYWKDSRFRAKRPDRSPTADNIYRMLDGRLGQVSNHSHDQRHVATDISGRHALVFSRSWHFGDHGPELEDDLGLRVPMQARRCEPLNEIDANLWIELEAFLDHYERGLPDTRSASKRTC